MIQSSKEVTDEAVRTIKKFQDGTLKPISFGDDGLGKWLNEAMLGGLLPGTVFSISGPSGHGKTHFLQRIENHMIKHNPDLVLLRVAWESNPFKMLLRKVQQETNIKMEDVMFKVQEGKNLEAIKRVVEEERKDNIFFLQKVVDAVEFYNIIEKFLAQHLDKKVVISIDHTSLVKGNGKDAMDGLVESINMLKRLHPYVVFLPLIQMERSRIQERIGQHHKEFPIRGDLYGSDSLYMLSEGVLVLLNPYKLGATSKYGVFPHSKYSYIDPKFITQGGKWSHFLAPHNIFYHLLKIRDISDISSVKEVYVESLYEPLKELPLPKIGSPNQDEVDSQFNF